MEPSEGGQFVDTIRAVGRTSSCRFALPFSVCPCLPKSTSVAGVAPWQEVQEEPIVPKQEGRVECREENPSTL